MAQIREYRGHIRNWKELCGELGLDLGLSREEREKAIIAAAYEKWGREMASHIYGMFAFSLWDEKEEKLFCLRDQFGTKPFYYYVTADNRLLCGTYIRDIMAQEGFVKELNEKMLQIYMSLTYVAGEDTFFKGLNSRTASWRSDATGSRNLLPMKARPLISGLTRSTKLSSTS